MGAQPDLPVGTNVNGGRVQLDTMIESAPDGISSPAVARALEGRQPCRRSHSGRVEAERLEAISQLRRFGNLCEREAHQESCKHGVNVEG
jgi:hypothetical protein